MLSTSFSVSTTETRIGSIWVVGGDLTEQRNPVVEGRLAVIDDIYTPSLASRSRELLGSR
jgi:hypothetical protein